MEAPRRLLEYPSVTDGELTNAQWVRPSWGAAERRAFRLGKRSHGPERHRAGPLRSSQLLDSTARALYRSRKGAAAAAGGHR